MKFNNPNENPFKNRKFHTYFQLSMIAVCFVIVFVIFYACQRNSASNAKLDLENVELVQYEKPSDDTPVVVFETNKGTFKAVIYEDEVPNFAKNFIDLVNQGYYDGTYVFAVQEDVYFMGGAKADNGVNTSDTNTETMDQELSPNLWPFKGALISYGDKGGSFLSQKVLSGSRILFVDSVEFTDEFKEQLDSANGNEDVVNAFKANGGVPNFSQQYTIFGQVYDGMDIYDNICAVKVTDSESLQPSNAVTFDKVYMSTYGENKNDEFFTMPTEKTADSNNSQSESSAAE